MFPERRVFDVNVENWKVTYEESPDDLTVKQYLQMRLAAVVRLTSDLGPARVISTPSQTESRTEIDLYRHIAAILETCGPTLADRLEMVVSELRLEAAIKAAIEAAEAAEDAEDAG